MHKLAAKLAVIFSLALPLAAQDIGDVEVVHPNQRVIIPDLLFITAPDTGSPAVAKAAVAIVLSGSKIKCDPGSQVEHMAETIAGPSLRALADKISGASCATNGQIRRIAANFVPNTAIQADNLLASLLQRKPLLMEWKNELFVLYGIVYDERLHSDGHRVNVIRELLLIDPRYSDKRRLKAFVREKDNLAEVAGVASVTVADQ